MPAPDLLSFACALYALYASPPVAVARKVALGGKLTRLAWTGEGRFAFGLVRVTQPFPLRRRAVRADRPGLTIRLLGPRPGGMGPRDSRRGVTPA